jgi:hypothetical protein
MDSVYYLHCTLDRRHSLPIPCDDYLPPQTSVPGIRVHPSGQAYTVVGSGVGGKSSSTQSGGWVHWLFAIGESRWLGASAVRYWRIREKDGTAGFWSGVLRGVRGTGSSTLRRLRSHLLRRARGASLCHWLFLSLRSVRSAACAGGQAGTRKKALTARLTATGPIAVVLWRIAPGWPRGRHGCVQSTTIGRT